MTAATTHPECHHCTIKGSGGRDRWCGGFVGAPVRGSDCPACNGTAQLLPTFATFITCTICNGSGNKPLPKGHRHAGHITECDECHGFGIAAQKPDDLTRTELKPSDIYAAHIEFKLPDQRTFAEIWQFTKAGQEMFKKKDRFAWYITPGTRDGVEIFGDWEIEKANKAAAIASVYAAHITFLKAQKGAKQ